MFKFLEIEIFIKLFRKYTSKKEKEGSEKIKAISKASDLG